MQARLKQIGWFSGDVSNNYGSRTTEAVQGFQRKRGSRSPASPTSAPTTGSCR